MDIVRKVDTGLDLTPSVLRRWPEWDQSRQGDERDDSSMTTSGPRRVEQARADRTRGRTGVTTVEREELARLRKEVRELRVERGILKKPRWVQVLGAT